MLVETLAQSGRRSRPTQPQAPLGLGLVVYTPRVKFLSRPRVTSHHVHTHSLSDSAKSAVHCLFDSVPGLGLDTEVKSLWSRDSHDDGGDGMPSRSHAQLIGLG